MKKKYFYLLILLVRHFLVTIGLSSWYISESTNFKPEYALLDIIEKYYNNQEVPYNISAQGPSSSDPSKITDEIVYSKCTVGYRKAGTSNIFSAQAPSNAGVYDVKFTYQSKSIILKFSILSTLFDVEEYGYTVESASLSAIIEGEQSKTRTGGALKDGTGNTISGTIT